MVAPVTITIFFVLRSLLCAADRLRERRHLLLRASRRSFQGKSALRIALGAKQISNRQPID